MLALDWIIIGLYLFLLIGLSAWWGRKHTNQDDYYLGNRSLPWWAIGISTMATQTSAISFISIPAFVALKEGGGLRWLQYELAVPIAMIPIMLFLIPYFRSLKLVSVYEYLEMRFGPSVRNLVSGVFLISRGLATGVGLYASAIVLSVILGLPIWATILLIGIVTIIYDVLGGMTAVVYSDVIQMGVLLTGIICCIYFAVNEIGSFSQIWESLPDSRKQTIDLSTGLGDGGSAPFWAFLFGGLFLYASYYGTDQSQVQRGLSAASKDEARKALMLNGLARFPLTLLYLVLGVSIYAVYHKVPELREAVPLDKPDYLVPEYILLMLPSGVKALLFAALLAAAMSSLDSSLNSLSAATMRDFIGKWNQGVDHIKWGKLSTLVWGVLITAFAFVVGNISDTVIESINKIGSAFYGPVLAAFIVGVLDRAVHTKAMLAGIISGVVFNLILWLGDINVYWMWWNVFGFVVTTLVAFVSSRLVKTEIGSAYYLRWQDMKKEATQWRHAYVFLVIYFIGILALIVGLN